MLVRIQSSSSFAKVLFECVAHAFAGEHNGRVSVASTAAEVVDRCDTTYSMLSTLDASRVVVSL